MQQGQIAEAGKVGYAEASVSITESLRIDNPLTFGIFAGVWAGESDEAAGAFDVFYIVTIGGGFACTLHSDTPAAE